MRRWAGEMSRHWFCTAAAQLLGSLRSCCDALGPVDPDIPLMVMRWSRCEGRGAWRWTKRSGEVESQSRASAIRHVGVYPRFSPECGKQRVGSQGTTLQ